MMKLVSTAIVETYQKGDFAEYRIPAVAVMDDGTVVTAYEARRGPGGDWAEIWLPVRRSTDAGRSFEPPCYPHQKIVDRSAKDTITWNNPVLIADGELLHFLFCSDYSRVWYCRSEDSGKTFSEPTEITDCFRALPAKWNVCAVGPGHGITAADGRLVVPIWIALGEERRDIDPSGRIKWHMPCRSGCIVSEDRGRSWEPGFLTSGIENASEAEVSPLSDGSFLFNFRNVRFENCRVLGIAAPDLHGLTKVWSECGLPDPQCMGGMTRAGERLYFVNCANSVPVSVWGGKRINLTISESADEGRTWTPVQPVDELGGYADIAADRDGLYVLYEQGLNGKIQKLILNRYLW